MSQIWMWLEESPNELHFDKAAGKSRELQNLLAQAEYMQIAEGILYRRFEDKHRLTVFRQLVAPVALSNDLLHHIQGRTAFGHF